MSDFTTVESRTIFIIVWTILKRFREQCQSHSKHDHHDYLDLDLQERPKSPLNMVMEFWGLSSRLMAIATLALSDAISKIRDVESVHDLDLNL